MKYLFSIFLMLYALTCHAAIYMQTDANGNITYSDSPSNNAVEINVPTASSVSAPPVGQSKKTKVSAAPVESEGKPRVPYTDFSIVNPADQQTFQNQRDIPVEIKIEPALQKKDKIQLFLDGVPYGEPQETPHLLIHQVDRGTHVIYAVLLKEDQTVLRKSNTITIYIHYQSANGAG